jgi:glycosyltransferase involved in cell wall biosynthesis
MATLMTSRQLPQTVSVIIAAYSDERWEYLRDAVASVRAQAHQALETIVVIDHNPGLLTRAAHGLDGAVVLANTGARGASGARNTGVAASHGEIVAFLDDDARATTGWLATLLAHFAEPRVVGVGGRVDPLWSSARPAWFPGEFDWTVGASYTGMPQTPTEVRNVWSNNMAIRRSAFDAVGGFREELGKVGTRSRPEDTDLCLRANSGVWVYEPSGAVDHWVPPQRARLRYFLRRCYNEGRGKAELAAADSTGTSTSVERSYARTVLPKAALRGLREALGGDVAGALRSAAIVAGLGAAAAGFAVGRRPAMLSPGGAR